MISFARMVMVVFVAGMMLTGCGSNDNASNTPEVQSQNTMKEAFTYLHQAGAKDVSAQDQSDNLVRALAKTIDAYELYPNQESLLVKAFIEIGQKDVFAAEVTLSKVETEYPGSSEDEFLRAYLNAQEGKDASVVFGNLKTSLDNNFSELPDVLWWAFLDKLPAFANFKTTSQYQDLLAMKAVAKTAGKSADRPYGYVCKENYTKYRNHWYGMEIDISHEVVIGVKIAIGAGIAAAPLLLFADGGGIAAILEAYFIAELFAIQIVDDNGGDCGVKLYNTWLTLPIFIPFPQK